MRIRALYAYTITCEGSHVHERSAAQFAVSLVREAALMIRRSGRPRRALRTKVSHTDVVTGVDLRVERYLRRRIEAEYPRHHIVGEETPEGHVESSGPTWFVDPVDGTTNFLHGLPFFACNVAFAVDGQVVAGATADIARRRIYWAELGKGAWVGRRRLRVSRTRGLRRAVLTTGFPANRAVSPDNNVAEFSSLVMATRDIKRIGCAGIDLAWVADGSTDGYWEHGDGPWDWAVGSLLVSEAGGVVTDYDGEPWRPWSPTLCATNGNVHDEVLAHVRTARGHLGVLVLKPI